MKDAGEFRDVKACQPGVDGAANRRWMEGQPAGAMDDETCMRRALELARMASGRTSPNPMVGAVVVRDGRVVGEGYHRRAGTPHAEVLALQQAGPLARGATLFVNLEPCAHQGRTPPCTRAIIEAGVRRVVAAMVDPNPLVGGKGLEELRQAGIQVDVGVLEKESMRLNEAFAKFITTRRPFVSMKCALSLDGKAATRSGESQWISGDESRARGHELRDRYDAIMVGVGTVIRDDPLLTTRLRVGEGRDPLRIIVDSRCRTPLEARVIKHRSRVPTVIATTEGSPRERREALRQSGAEVWVLRSRGERVDLQHLLEEMGKREIISVLLEGGPTLNAGALEAGIVDKLYFFIAPIIIGGREAPGPVGGEGAARLSAAARVTEVQVERLGEDLLVSGYLEG